MSRQVTISDKTLAGGLFLAGVVSALVAIGVLWGFAVALLIFGLLLVLLAFGAYTARVEAAEPSGPRALE